MNMGVSSYIFNSVTIARVGIATARSVYFLTSYASVNAQFNLAKPHHTAEGFENNYTTSAPNRRAWASPCVNKIWHKASSRSWRLAKPAYCPARSLHEKS